MPQHIEHIQQNTTQLTQNKNYRFTPNKDTDLMTPNYTFCFPESLKFKYLLFHNQEFECNAMSAVRQEANLSKTF